MQTIVLSLGGSIINPGEIDVKFLTSFRKIILKYIKRNRIIIVAGGGNTARKYQQAASKITKVTDIELDWLGIKATKINAELVRAIFYKEAYERVIDDPTKKLSTNKRIIVGSGWLPGFSSDKDAVLLAQNFNADTVINMTNVDYVYTKDPRKFKDARAIKSMSWKEMLSLVGSKWTPGANLPFDPVASKKASELKLRVIIMSSNLKNFENFLNSKQFKGTVVS